MSTRPLTELLGHPADARLLIINADDFGMCHAENAATVAGLEQGAFCSATIMVPCPWFAEAVEFGHRRRDADLGVHVTHTSEWERYKWGPLLGRSAVPSMVDSGGHLHRTTEAVYAHARLDEVEAETRAQINAALAAGVDVTHLDSHMGTLQLDVNYHALYVRLAAEYQLPIRMVRGERLRDMGFGAIVDQADHLGVLRPDYFYVGGPPRPEATPSFWTKLLKQLRPGVSELYIHAAYDAPEMQAMSDSWRQRRADFDFFTAPATKSLLADLGITLIGYRALREVQRRLTPC
ncbi:MAG: polysaccharide deacetylase family protein [Deltaproteobacteria bacterium]|nr:polysaccharide deacetylase family protein [Deltaproteobacteria bacterium]MBI3387723.1 polysaccharide deacetylase family protein [Deltaproteobacteria bacterium]